MRNQGSFQFRHCSYICLSWSLCSNQSFHMQPPIIPHILDFTLPGAQPGLALLFLCKELGVKKPNSGWHAHILLITGKKASLKRKLSTFGASPQKPYLHRLKVSPLSNDAGVLLFHWCTEIQREGSQRPCTFKQLMHTSLSYCSSP